MIPFTQYMLPDGRRVETGIDRPAEIEAKARAIIARGFVFEAEVLTTGDVSVTIADPRIEQDVEIEVVPNGPQVSKAIDRMILRFNPEGGRADAAPVE